MAFMRPEALVLFYKGTASEPKKLFQLAKSEPLFHYF